jgi:hypothetical protein
MNINEDKTTNETKSDRSFMLGIKEMFKNQAHNKNPISSFGDRHILGMFTTLNKNIFELGKSIKNFPNQKLGEINEKNSPIKKLSKFWGSKKCPQSKISKKSRESNFPNQK